MTVITAPTRSETLRPSPLSRVADFGRRFALRALERLGLAAVLVLIWQAVASRSANIFFPPPADIFGRLRDNWFSAGPSRLFMTDAFFADVLPSMTRALAGWILGGLIGITLGMIAGRWVVAQGYIDPPLTFIRALPKPAVVPIFLIVFGATDGMRVALIAFGCTWPVLINTLQGARGIDPTLRDTGRAFGVPLYKQFLMIMLPAATPKIAAGLRVSLSLALILMVLSEWILADNGLGRFLITSQRSFQILDMWSALLLLGILGYLVNVAFLAAEKRILAWHAGYTGTAIS